MSVQRPLHRAILIAVFAGVAKSVFVWIARNDPGINFLPRDSRAAWIVFPVAVNPHGHWFTGLDATFRREFVLTERPSTALLSVRAMRRAEVKINGTSVRFPPQRNWKNIVSADVAEQLHTGTNVIETQFSITMDHRHSG